MWPRSERFDESVARSGRRYTRVDVLRDGIQVQPTADLIVTAGQIGVDRQTISRDLTITLLDTSGGGLFPTSVDDLLAPFVAELRVWMGVQYWDATPAEIYYGTDSEFVPVGTFPIVNFAGSPPLLTLTGYDRMWFLGDLELPFATIAGEDARSALIRLLQTKIPASKLQYNIPDSDATVPAMLYEDGTSAADAAHAIALAMGLRLYADQMGVITAGPEPSIEDTPAMRYEPGALSAMLLRPTRGLQGEQFVNACTFKSEAPGSGAALLGYAEDTDPSSMTYAARVGVRSLPQSSPLMVSPAMVQRAAETTLTREIGIPDNIVVPVLANPAHESGDVLYLVDPALRIDFPVLADSFPVPLDWGEQPITCRQRVLR